MSRELRKAMLHCCNNYLEKLDQLETLANVETTDSTHPATASEAEPQQGDDVGDVDTKTTEDKSVATTSSTSSGDARNSIWSTGDGAAHGDTALSTPENSTDSTIPGEDPKHCAKIPISPAVAVTAGQRNNLEKWRQNLISIVASIRKGMSRLDKDERAKYNFRWAEAGRLNGQRPIKPERCLEWRNAQASLRIVMDDEWLRELEMAEAWHQSDTYYHRDDLNRQVLKL